MCPKGFCLFPFLFAIAQGNEVIWLAQPFLVFSISTASGRLPQVFKVNLSSLFKTTGRDVGRVWDVASSLPAFLKAAITKPSIILKVLLLPFCCQGPRSFTPLGPHNLLAEICINPGEECCFKENHFVITLLCVSQFC